MGTGYRFASWATRYAVTRASADVEDYDVATEMERIGGSVIEMPKQVWRELLAA